MISKTRSKLSDLHIESSQYLPGGNNYTTSGIFQAKALDFKDTVQTVLPIKIKILTLILDLLICLLID